MNTRLIRYAAAATVSASVWSFHVPNVFAEDPPATRPATRPVESKALSQNVTRGLNWLAKMQNEDGGWDQGERSAEQGRGGEKIEESNVADTCMAALTLLRSGSTPSKGEYAKNIFSAAHFISGQVEKASNEGLFITDIKGTRVQSKLGQYIDTFAAALLLAELKGQMPDEASNARVAAALKKTLEKIEKNQQEDGRWVDANDGWASALCQSVAHKAVNRAAQVGAPVAEQTLVRAEKFANQNFDGTSGGVGGAGSANIELYARASNLQQLQDSANSNVTAKEDLAKKLDYATTQVSVVTETMQQAEKAGDEQKIAQAKAQLESLDSDIKGARTRLGEIDGNELALRQAQQAVVEKMNDQQFVAGFGSNGGEEFLSYMNIGESLVLAGGDEFATWDKKMTENLNQVQNEDGSWSGHHCITGRTFCTSTALMTLMTDRAPQMNGAITIRK